MIRDTVSRRQALQGLVTAALPLGMSGCAKANPDALLVGGLPVTCNLTVPVASVAKGISNKLAPLVMDLADKGIPMKIASLGHRSGAVIMVRTEAPYQHFRQLAGKRIAVPSRFAVDFLFLRRMLAQESMTIADVQIVEMALPDMPAALYANAVDANCTGEPFGAAPQSAGYARPLRPGGHRHDHHRPDWTAARRVYAHAGSSAVGAMAICALKSKSAIYRRVSRRIEAGCPSSKM